LTDTALHHLVNGVETLGAKGYALGVFIDIEGVFDSTSNKSIKEAITKREVSEALVDWTHNILTNRNITVSLDTVSIGGVRSAIARRGSSFPFAMSCSGRTLS